MAYAILKVYWSESILMFLSRNLAKDIGFWKQLADSDIIKYVNCLNVDVEV